MRSNRRFGCFISMRWFNNHRWRVDMGTWQLERGRFTRAPRRRVMRASQQNIINTAAYACSLRILYVTASATTFPYLQA
jgi:hypothetical protein